MWILPISPYWDWLVPRYLNPIVASWFPIVGVYLLVLTNPIIHEFFYRLAMGIIRLRRGRLAHWTENMRINFKGEMGRPLLWTTVKSKLFLVVLISFSFIMPISIWLVSQNPDRLVTGNHSLQELNTFEFQWAMMFIVGLVLSSIIISLTNLWLSSTIFTRGLYTRPLKLKIAVSLGENNPNETEISSGQKWFVIRKSGEIQTADIVDACGLIGCWDEVKGWRVLSYGDSVLSCSLNDRKLLRKSPTRLFSDDLVGINSNLKINFKLILE